MLDLSDAFFKNLFDSLENNSVLMRVEEDGSYKPVWCTGGYASMIEGTREEFISLERDNAMATIHEDDRDEVAYLFRHHAARDGSNSLTIRKRTLKGNELWMNVHYAFVKDGDEQYAYCTYTDVTELKKSQQQTMAMYEELNKELNALSNESLAALRSNLTKGIVEEVHGTDLYDVDKAGAPIEDLMTVRLANMPLASDRETYLEVFDLARLQEKYYLGEGPTSLVIFSRRQSGRQCFIKYSAAMRKDPVTGDVIVLGVETEYNSQKVTEVLNDKVLARQYEMVSYIVGENYGVVIGDGHEARAGSIFPEQSDGLYMDYIRESVIPTVAENERQAVLAALSLPTITSKLENMGDYTVDVACEIGGEVFNKRFTFYAVDKDTDFYIVLESDVTDMLRGQREREHNQTIHNSMLEQFNAIAEESLTVVRSNVTTGKIEDIRGTDLYPSDYAGNAITAYSENRMRNILVEADRARYIDAFDIDELLERSAKGLGPATMVAYCRRASGRQCFVKFSGSASKNPVTGDVDAFGIETEYDIELVSEVMNKKILARQYDMVAYIVGGYYGVAIGDAANIERGSIFPNKRDGLYMDYIQGQVIPAVAEKGRSRDELLEALSLETIEAELGKAESYTVDVPCDIYGEIFHKRFVFYSADAESRAYILLKSDVTDIIQEQSDREQTQTLYNSMLDQFNAIADVSLAVQRTNLTTGLIEESRGTDLYDTDYAGGSIAESARVRSESFLVEGDREKYEEAFELDKLLDRTGSGQGPATFIGYCKRQSGRHCFVKFSGSASRNPVTGDVIAFGVETEYNTEMINQVLDEKVLAQQYDMITYVVSGHYGVAIGDAANIGKGSIFPKERNGVYADYISEQVVPLLAGTPEENAEVAEALSLESIERNLAESEPYTVDVACEIGGEVFNKRFMFYAVDLERKFYILLKTDMTDILREQRERNEILANALQEAEQANAAKTAFLSSMSHEIRTPMNAIIGLDEIALGNPDIPAETREQLEKIGGSAKHLLGLINDILDMSRIESGRMSLRHEEFSFSEMLGQVNTIVNGQCVDKGLKYQCRINGKVDDYYIGDDMKLKQVIINILGNAVKFTPEGGSVSFIVEPVSQFDDKATMRFTMQDTGIGMDAAYLPKIFDTFSQEDEGKANKYGSTGLGMAITKRIIEMMNGTITVESEKGVGTTFVVTVTLRTSDRRAHDVEDLRPQDMHVLVIDDDPVACEHAKMVLEEVGIASETCHSGKEALEMLKLAHARREPYNLILVDLRMPEQDGVEVTRQIRNLYDGESTIIILTAYSWDDIEEEAVEAGVDSFMPKPLFASGVLQELKKVIMSRSERSDEAHRADLEGRRVLLAEDVLINAEIMEELLSVREVAVDHAENGKIAVEMFERSEVGYYDAVLMDVRMPVMTGLEATVAIRALDRPDAATVPIIAMTANAFDEDVQNSLQAGMNAHLSKPVEIDHLYETLETLIKD